MSNHKNLYCVKIYFLLLGETGLRFLKKMLLHYMAKSYFFFKHLLGYIAINLFEAFIETVTEFLDLPQ